MCFCVHFSSPSIRSTLDKMPFVYSAPPLEFVLHLFQVGAMTKAAAVTAAREKKHAQVISFISLERAFVLYHFFSSIYDEWSWIIHKEIVILIKYIYTMLEYTHTYTRTCCCCHHRHLRHSQSIEYVIQSESTSSPSNYKDIENDARPFNHELSYCFIFALCLALSLSLIFVPFLVSRIIPNGNVMCSSWGREFNNTDTLNGKKKQNKNSFSPEIEMLRMYVCRAVLSVSKQWKMENREENNTQICSILSFIKICKNSYFPLFHCNQLQTFPFQIAFTSENNSATKLTFKIQIAPTVWFNILWIMGIDISMEYFALFTWNQCICTW